jgi:hypothetical protein
MPVIFYSYFPPSEQLTKSFLSPFNLESFGRPVTLPAITNHDTTHLCFGPRPPPTFFSVHFSALAVIHSCLIIISCTNDSSKYPNWPQHPEPCCQMFGFPRADLHLPGHVSAALGREDQGQCIHPRTLIRLLDPESAAYTTFAMISHQLCLGIESKAVLRTRSNNMDESTAMLGKCWQGSLGKPRLCHHGELAWIFIPSLLWVLLNTICYYRVNELPHISSEDFYIASQSRLQQHKTVLHFESFYFSHLTIFAESFYIF